MTSHDMHQVKDDKLGMHDESSEGYDPCLCDSAALQDGLQLELLMARMAASSA